MSAAGGTGMAAGRVRAGALLACGLAGLVTASGCGSGSGPSWAPALGPDVTVTAPARVAPGHGSPGGAIAGLVAAISARRYAAACGYVEPAEQAACRAAEAEPASQQSARN